MYLKETLEEILPTKWLRRTVVLTFSSSIAAFNLPYLWPLSKLTMTNTEIQIFQVLLSVATLLIGTLICLVLTIIAYNKQRKELSDKIYKLENPPPPPISFTEIKVNRDFMNDPNQKINKNI
jgi:hypothetical protein